jgi:hypothetical protein
LIGSNPGQHSLYEGAGGVIVEGRAKWVRRGFAPGCGAHLRGGIEAMGTVRECNSETVLVYFIPWAGMCADPACPPALVLVLYPCCYSIIVLVDIVLLV